MTRIADDTQSIAQRMKEIQAEREKAKKYPEHRDDPPIGGTDCGDMGDIGGCW